jgi:hypothetical protein
MASPTDVMNGEEELPAEPCWNVWRLPGTISSIGIRIGIPKIEGIGIPKTGGESVENGCRYGVFPLCLAGDRLQARNRCHQCPYAHIAALQ